MSFCLDIFRFVFSFVLQGQKNPGKHFLAEMLGSFSLNW